MVSLSASIFFGIEPIILVTFIVAMSITHVFIDFIPSIYLGAPDDSSALSVLPGHQMLKEGKAQEAILLTSLGCIFALVSILIISPLLISALPFLDAKTKLAIPYILIAVSLFLIFTEKHKFTSLLIFTLAGVLGYSALNLPLQDSLLPLLSGLFGASTLIISIKQKTKIPEQKSASFQDLEISKKEFFTSSLISSSVSSLLGFLPSLGSGQIAIISSQIKKTNNKQFLIMLGAANMAIMVLSFLVLYSINKSRTGSAAAIHAIIPKLTVSQIILILFIIFLAGVISFFLSLRLSKIFSSLVSKINYSRISMTILIFVTLIVFIFSGFLGLLVFIISTSLGIFANLCEIKRTNLMGCLLVPTILLYLL